MDDKNTMTTALQLVTIEPDGTHDASIIWLHGLGADGHDFEPIVPALSLPQGHGVRFVFPHAPIRPITINGGMEMRAWYDIVDQGLERSVDEDGIRGSAASIRALLDREIDAGIASERIVLAGFSQGGAIALHLGLRYPRRLAGILALSTYLPLTESLGTEANEAQANISIFIGHGSYDPLVPEELGRRSAQMLGDAGYNVDYSSYPMQHAVSPEEIRDIAQWLAVRLPAE